MENSLENMPQYIYKQYHVSKVKGDALSNSLNRIVGGFVTAALIMIIVILKKLTLGKIDIIFRCQLLWSPDTELTYHMLSHVHIY